MKLLYVSISAKTDCLHHRWCVVSKLWIREDLNDLLNKSGLQVWDAMLKKKHCDEKHCRRQTGESEAQGTFF